MQIGELKHRVTVRTWSDVPTGTFGTEETLDAGFTVSAAINPTKGAVYYGAKQTGNEVTHLIIMRYSGTANERTVSPEKVIECDGLRYRVKRSMNEKGQGRFLQVECELLGAINV